MSEKAAQFDSADMEYLLGCKAAYQQELETRTKFQHELNALEQERDELRKDAEKWRDLCSRAGVNPNWAIAYAGPLEGAPEDWAAIAPEPKK